MPVNRCAHPPYLTVIAPDPEDVRRAPDLKWRAALFNGKVLGTSPAHGHAERCSGARGHPNFIAN